jgi:hypothetical protein
VPRLRGRGEQGMTVRQAGLLAALCVCVEKLASRYRAPAKMEYTSRFSPAHHGLASEARSTRTLFSGGT